MSDAVKEQHKEYIKASIEAGDLTAEEVLELGVWMTGKGIGQAWQDAMGKPPD